MLHYKYLNYSACIFINPLTTTSAIWQFTIITRAAVCPTSADMFRYASPSAPILKTIALVGLRLLG